MFEIVSPPCEYGWNLKDYKAFVSRSDLAGTLGRPEHPFVRWRYRRTEEGHLWVYPDTAFSKAFILPIHEVTEIFQMCSLVRTTIWGEEVCFFDPNPREIYDDIVGSMAKVMVGGVGTYRLEWDAREAELVRQSEMRAGKVFSIDSDLGPPFYTIAFDTCCATKHLPIPLERGWSVKAVAEFAPQDVRRLEVLFTFDPYIDDHYVYNGGLQVQTSQLKDITVTCPNCRVRNRIRPHFADQQPVCGRCGHSLKEVEQHHMLYRDDVFEQWNEIRPGLAGTCYLFGKLQSAGCCP